MRWPIRNQILLPFAGLMLLAVAGVSSLDAWLAARRSEQQINKQLREVARTLLDSRFPLNDVVLRQMRGLSGAEFVLTTVSGRRIASSGLSATEIPPPSTPVARWEELDLGSPVVIDDQIYFQAAVRMNGRGIQPELLLLHILYPEQIWQESRREAAIPPLVVGASALVGFALLALAIAARLSRPILQVSSRVGRMAQGDFQPLPLPERNDELRDLVLAVNSLAGQLDEMRRAIQRSERLTLLGKLSGGLAHHLRNDVAGARMAVQLHQRHCHAADRESLEVALRQLALTEDHLQRFLAAGQPELPQQVHCDLRAIVDDLVGLLSASFKHRKVSLSVSADSHAQLPLHADPDQLRHLLMNLVLNALEAAGSGGWVRIEALISDDSVTHLRVLDSGDGPPAEFASGRLFEPFSTSKPEGVGLGLAVARQIAEAHGGALEYTRRNQHTCFELTLPPPAAEPAALPHAVHSI
jgi:signal transduction histidine kinase